MNATQQQWLDEQFEAAYPKAQGRRAQGSIAHYSQYGDTNVAPVVVDIEGSVVFRGRGPGITASPPKVVKSCRTRFLEALLFTGVVLVGVGFQAIVLCALTASPSCSRSTLSLLAAGGGKQAAPDH